MRIRLIATLALLIFSCSSSKDEEILVDTAILFGSPQRVTLQGYDGQIMEPFLSRDGSILFFNNLNNPLVDTNLHWSTRVNNTLFEYQGELQGVATESLEGVPSMDQNNTLYYVYTGDYFQTLQSIYSGTYSQGSMSNIAVVENLSLNEPGWLNFDVEVSNDGQSLYFVDGLYDENGGPRQANFSIARKIGNEFQRDPNSAMLNWQILILMILNTQLPFPKMNCNCALLELLEPFRSIPKPISTLPSRTDTSMPFSEPQEITEITGFVEGPTFSANDNGLYYHKKENADFVLYYIEKLP